MKAETKSNCSAGPPRMDLKDCCNKAKILDEVVFRNCFTKIASGSSNGLVQGLVKPSKNGKQNNKGMQNNGEEVLSLKAVTPQQLIILILVCFTMHPQCH